MATILYDVVYLHGKRLLCEQHRGTSFPLVDAADKGGMSYAHVLGNTIMRNGERIGDANELIYTDQIEPVAEADLLSGIILMTAKILSRGD